MQNALPDFNITGPQVEEGIQRGAALLSLFAWMGLVGRTVRIGDEVKNGVVDDQAAQENARAPEIPQAEAQSQVIGPGVGRFAGVFKAVNHHPAGIGLQVERLPVKCGDLHTAAGRIFQRGDQLLANDPLECG